MFIIMEDVFAGMSKESVKAIRALFTEEQKRAGDLVYKSGDSADYFYILDKGHVTLSYGQLASITYVLNQGGEGFGLSSLLRDSAYSATAQCKSPSRIRKVEKDKLEEFLARHPDAARAFFKRLAGTLFQRMIDSHNSLLSAYQGPGVPSYG
ncbi:MAG: cyclic nucleotide-binding domain-containing protein [bacterium]